jgi:hypothetical protein
MNKNNKILCESSECGPNFCEECTTSGGFTTNFISRRAQQRDFVISRESKPRPSSRRTSTVPPEAGLVCTIQPRHASSLLATALAIDVSSGRGFTGVVKCAEPVRQWGGSEVAGSRSEGNGAYSLLVCDCAVLV